MRLRDYPQEDLIKAKKLVASFIKAAEEVEEVMIDSFFMPIFEAYEKELSVSLSSYSCTPIL